MDAFVVYTGDLEWNARIEAVFEDEADAKAVADQLGDGAVERVSFWRSGTSPFVQTEHSYILDAFDRSKDYKYETTYLGDERPPSCSLSKDRVGAVTSFWGRGPSPEAAESQAVELHRRS